MSTVNLYLNELNTSESNTTQGSFNGINSGGLSGTNANLYYQAPLATWQGIFKFYTDDGADITNEGVTLFTEQGLNIIGDSSATSSNVQVSGLYSANASTAVTYTANIINDISTALSNTTDPAAALDFTRELARAVFGSPEAVDMFTNESTIYTSYADAIELCASNICNVFGGPSQPTLYGNISSGANLLTVKRIYDQLRHTDITRFSMGYGAAFKTGTVSFTDGNNLPVTLNSSITTATVDVLMTGTTIDSIVVNTTGSGFQKGDTITITNSDKAIEIILTSVQASMLNGTLNSVSGTELPLIQNDIFHIQLTITNNASQQNSSGKVLNTIGDTVSRAVDLYVKLM